MARDENERLLIKQDYERFYRRVKVQIVDRLDTTKISPDVRGETVERIRLLPHPLVASELDIESVCWDFVAGPLEYLYQYFGEEARRLHDAARRFRETREGRWQPMSMPPVPHKEADISDVTRMLSWTNNTLFLLSSTLARTAADLTLKSQCPFCYGDLIMVKVGDELRLRCRDQKNQECRDNDWYVANLGARKPPQTNREAERQWR